MCSASVVTHLQRSGAPSVSYISRKMNHTRAKKKKKRAKNDEIQVKTVPSGESATASAKPAEATGARYARVGWGRGGHGTTEQNRKRVVRGGGLVSWK